LRLVVFGWGNDARGDDGLGPLLLARVARAGWPDVATIEDFQLQIEHALDLDGAEAALFVDAGRDTPAPFAFAEIRPERGESHTTHALAPEAVLDVYARSLRRPPPSAFLLIIRGESFELGDGLSPVAADRLEVAWDFLQGLMRNPSVEDWRRMAGPQGGGNHPSRRRSEFPNADPDARGKL
jgi:hydrogenase maturation protease